MTATSKYRSVVGGLLASGLLIIGTSTAVAASTGDVAVVLNSPSDIVWDTLDAVFGEVANIGTAILFVYGFIHMVKIGTDSGDTSGSVKKLGLSWGLGIFIQAWEVLQDFVRDTGDDVAGNTITPLVTEHGMNVLVAVGYVPV